AAGHRVPGAAQPPEGVGLHRGLGRRRRAHRAERDHRRVLELTPARREPGFATTRPSGAGSLVIQYFRALRPASYERQRFWCPPARSSGSTPIVASVSSPTTTVPRCSCMLPRCPLG